MQIDRILDSEGRIRGMVLKARDTEESEFLAELYRQLDTEGLDDGAQLSTLQGQDERAEDTEEEGIDPQTA